MPGSSTGVLSRELLPVSIAVFATTALASFQALGIAAALPDIATDLGAVSLLPWAITAFLLTSSLATVVAGPFIDAVGVSRMFRPPATRVSRSAPPSAARCSCSWSPWNWGMWVWSAS